MLACSFLLGALPAAQAGQPVVVVENGAGSLPTFAASEVRRYFYLRTGQWLGLRGETPPAALATGLPMSDVFRSGELGLGGKSEAQF